MLSRISKERDIIIFIQALATKFVALRYQEFIVFKCLGLKLNTSRELMPNRTEAKNEPKANPIVLS